MKRFSILLALVIMLAGASVPAQVIQPAPQPIGKILSVQDPEGDGYIWFNVFTGEFTCNMCEYKYSFSGRGQVKVDGMNIYLRASTKSYQLYISINVKEKQGMAVMEILEAPGGQVDILPFEELWVDPNISDNILECRPIKE